MVKSGEYNTGEMLALPVPPTGKKLNKRPTLLSAMLSDDMIPGKGKRGGKHDDPNVNQNFAARNVLICYKHLLILTLMITLICFRLF